jgi:hypothetical protein
MYALLSIQILLEYLPMPELKVSVVEYSLTSESGIL